ncbi:hypothetical protein RND81_07G038100 [Saponaria officinalis]|uniref:Uncharacterized protein n=1 Tax=Saponaria officinalis TaxID=3572 RepID=A0AAW1JNG3_SAPOF
MKITNPTLTSILLSFHLFTRLSPLTTQYNGGCSDQRTTFASWQILSPPELIFPRRQLRTNNHRNKGGLSDQRSNVNFVGSNFPGGSGAVGDSINVGTNLWMNIY